MDKNFIKLFNEFIQNASVEQKKHYLEQLSDSIYGKIEGKVTECPCCEKDNFIKKGVYKGIQRYICKNTTQTFSYKSDLAISRVVKLNKLDKLMELTMTIGFLTLDEIQKLIKVSRPTAVSWRGKILTSLYKIVPMTGEVVEFDETNLGLSCKGRHGLLYPKKRGKKLVGDNPNNVKVFMAYSRHSKMIELYQSHMGRTKSRDVENFLGLKKDIIVYSDKHQAYKKYCNDSGVVQKAFLSSDHISLENNTVHNQTINYHTRALKNFLNDSLKGVTTKYLQCYLNWYMFIENVVKKDSGTIKNAVLSNKVALQVFKQKEKEFQYFLRNSKHPIIGKCNDKYYKEAIMQFDV